MEAIAKRITTFCVSKSIIDAEKAPWFQYGIAKRLSTLLAAIPLFIISSILTSFDISVVYYLSFALIRRRANGYHASSWLKCVIMSISIVSIFLGIIYRLLTPLLSLGVSILCVILVFILAPYDHELMHLNADEYIACQRSSRITSCISASVALLLFIFGMDRIGTAVVSGIATATFLLCLGHISDWRKRHEQQELPG